MPQLANLGHIDRALTNISIAYVQGADAFIADKVFPIVPVQKRSDVYFKYSKEDMFRDEVKERAQGAESAGGDYDVEVEDPYLCKKYAYHKDVTEEERTNYDSPLSVDRDTTEWLTHKWMLNRELNFANKFFKTGVWGTEFTGVTSNEGGNDILKWNNELSDPVRHVNEAMLQMAEETGKKPNFAIMAPDVFYALKRHGDIMDRIKYTQKGVITLDLIAGLFELDQIYIPWGILNKGPKTPKYSETTGDMNFIYKGSMLLGYKTSRPSLKSPSAGYIFTWTGLEGSGAYGGRIVRLPMDMLGLGTERYEIEGAYDQKVICEDMGMFFKDLV